MKTIEVTSSQDKELYAAVKDAYNEFGAVILKGLQLDQSEFESFTQMFCDKFYRVASRESLRTIAGDGYTTFTPKNNFYLFSHSDADYAPYPLTPNIGFLMCLKPPDKSGGETYLVDGVKMLKSLPQVLRSRFEHKNITYESLWEPERWKAQFKVSSEQELHLLLNNIKNVKFSLKNGMLHIFYSTSALKVLPDGLIAFSNAILGHLPYIDHPDYANKPILSKKTNNVYWEDSEPLSKDIVNQLITLQDQLKLQHQWLTNDILIFDNLRFMHGREMTDGESNRSILSRFGYTRSH